MSSRNVLFVALEPVSDEEVHDAIEARKEVADVNVLVVAPATGVGPLQWLTGAEDEARAEADELADRAADAVDAKVRTEVGDRDPFLAVEDALREFPADEIVLAGHPGGEAEAQLRRFGLPIERLNGRDDGTSNDAGGVEGVGREVARGRRSQAPFVAIAAVGAVILAVFAVVSLIAFVVVWLV